MKKTSDDTFPNRINLPGGGKNILRAIFKIPVLTYALFSLGLALILSLNWISVGSAQDSADHIRIVRALETDELGIKNPVGLAFSQKANAFHVLETHKPSLPPFGHTDIVMITAVEDKKGSARIAASITDPINTAFDNKFNRLLIFQPNSNKLILVDAAPDGSLDTSSLTRFDARHFDLVDPQGLAVDPMNGDLFILDSAVPQIVHIQPTADGSFEGASISQIDLQHLTPASLRGLAFDPSTATFHVLNPNNGNLYEITLAGQVVALRDLSYFNLDEPQGMVFAPSADQTDDPAVYNLYLADSGLATQGEQTFNSLESTTEFLTESTKQQNSGEILELSFNQVQAVQSASFTGILVNTIEAWKFNPPSPDSSGVTYLSN